MNPPGKYTQFSRLLLSRVFEEVRAVCPEARMNDARTTYTKIGSHKYYAVHIGGRPCYGKDFHWEGEAENAYDAKEKAWESWLRKGH